MPEVISQVLAPYLRQNFETDKSLSLITSTSATPAHWLVVRYLYAALCGVPNETRAPSLSSNDSSTHRRVVFVSILRSKDLWQELCKKVGLDLSAFVKAKRLFYVDGLSRDGSQADKSFESTQLQTLTLDNLLRVVRDCTTSTSDVDNTPMTSEKTTIIIDGIDFILASQPEVTATMVQQALSRLSALGNGLAASCAADGPLLHSRDEAATPLEREHASLISVLAHQAALVLQLRGLNTGAAKDVTGVLRISYGGKYENIGQSTTNIDEAEWLYQCKGDGSVRVWSRGD